MSLGERSASNKVRSRQAVSTLQGKLSHSEDVMEITGHTCPDGSPMTREMTVVFPSHLRQEWNGNFEVNLIFDDPEIYAMTANGERKHELVVRHVMRRIETYIMTVSIQNTSFIMKCNVKEVSSRYQSFYSQDRIITVIQREAEGYKYARNIPELKDKVIPMYAHGNLVQLDQRNLVILKEWEVMLLKQGSGMDLFLFATNHLKPPNIGKIKALTKESFRMLRVLHKHGISHGDSKVDQLIWPSDEKIGTTDLCWLDFGRCLINKNLDAATWNLRRLADINFMLCMNAFSVFVGYSRLDYRLIDMVYVRDKIQGNVSWDGGNNIVIKDFLLPALVIAYRGGLYDVDRNATEYVCRKFYHKDHIGFLEALDIDRFFDFLMTGENLFKMTTGIFVLAGKTEPMPIDYYDDDMITKHPKYSGATQPRPSPQSAYLNPPQQQQHIPRQVLLHPPAFTPAPVPVARPTQPQTYPPAPVPVPGPPPQALPQAVQPVQQTRYLVYDRHMLCSPSGKHYTYFMRGNSVILLEGANQVSSNIMPCFTVIDRQIVRLVWPQFHNAPLFFFLQPGTMLLLVYGQGGNVVQVGTRNI